MLDMPLLSHGAAAAGAAKAKAAAAIPRLARKARTMGLTPFRANRNFSKPQHAVARWLSVGTFDLDPCTRFTFRGRISCR